MAAQNAINTLRDLREGSALDDLADALANVVTHVRHTGRNGKVTLTLTIKPASKGNTQVIAIEDAVSMKLPSMERGSTLLYADEDGGLSRHDPRQPKLPELREVTTMRRPAAADAVATAAANEG